MGKAQANKNRGLSRDYISVLESYWDGRPQTAMEKLSQMIADNPDHADRFKLYRLWIDVLAHQEEKGTIRSLIDHLHLLSVMEPEASAVFMALRGIAYLEVDNFAAAGLCFKAVRQVEHCDYCNELKFLVKQRVSMGQPYSDLVGRVNRLEDYFQLKVVAMIAQRKRHEHLLTNVLKRVAKLFPKSPLLDELAFHSYVDVKDYSRASGSALALIQKFPGNFDYTVFAAFSCLKIDKVQSAIDLLERAIELGGESDLDVLTLLLTSYSLKNKGTEQSSQSSKTGRYLDKIARIKEEMGMLTYATPAEGTQNMEGPSFWIVKMNQREFFHIRDSKLESIAGLKRTLDEKAKKGDFVFFAADDYQSNSKKNRTSWRLAAVYQVSADLAWNPLDGFQATLRLVSRPEHTVPFDVTITGTSDLDEGVIAIDADSLDTITDAIKDHGHSDKTAQHLFQEISKVRISS